MKQAEKERWYLDGLEHLRDEGGRKLELLGRPLGEGDDLRVGICTAQERPEHQEPMNLTKRTSDGGGGGGGDGTVPRGFQVKASL